MADHNPQMTTCDRWLILAHEAALSSLVDLCRLMQQGDAATAALRGSVACGLERAAAHVRGHEYKASIAADPTDTGGTQFSGEKVS